VDVAPTAQGLGPDGCVLEPIHTNPARTLRFVVVQDLL
jgi:hypothetical protein